MTALKLVISSEFIVHSYFKKIIILFFLTCFLLLFPKITFAQSTATSSAQSTNYQLPTTNQYQALPAYVSPQSPTYANLQLYNIMHAFSCITIGQSMIGPCVDYQLNKNVEGQIKMMPVLSTVNTSGGVLGAGISILAGLYAEPPVNSGDYLNYLGEGFGLIPQAHAQVGGSGNTVLSPIFALWQVSRNIAYLVMILVFIIIGLMVMIRYKINPQTVVSVQMALPGLVIGLILITFSYFAAALITDLAYVGTDLVGYYFAQASGKEPGSLVQELRLSNVISVGSPFAGKLSVGEISGAAEEMIKNLDDGSGPGGDRIFNSQNMVRVVVALMSYQVGHAIGQVIGATTDTIAGMIPITRGPGVVNNVLSSLRGLGSRWSTPDGVKESAAQFNATAGIIFGTIFAVIGYVFPHFMIGWFIFLIALFAILYAIFRLLITLLTNYLQIIFLTITAPFSFLLASMPGRQGVAVDWARNMLCNVLAFPAVIAVFYFAAFLLGENKIRTFAVNQPLLLSSNTAALPLFGGLDLSFIRVLLAFAAIMAAPKVPEIICKVVGKPGGAGGAFEQAISQSIGQGQRYSGELQSNIGKVRGNIKESWDRLKGQDPYGALADKIGYYRRRRGFVNNENLSEYDKHWLWGRRTLHKEYEDMKVDLEAQREANRTVAPTPLTPRQQQRQRVQAARGRIDPKYARDMGIGEANPSYDPSSPIGSTSRQGILKRKLNK